MAACRCPGAGSWSATPTPQVEPPCRVPVRPAPGAKPGPSRTSSDRSGGRYDYPGDPESASSREEKAWPPGEVAAKVHPARPVDAAGRQGVPSRVRPDRGRGELLDDEQTSR